MERNSTSEVYFSLSDITDTTLNYIAVVSHKPPRANISRLKCFLNKSLESCSSRATYTDCQCVDEDDGLTFRLRKDFQADDSGEWMFTISGKGFSVNKTVNISVVPSEYFNVKNKKKLHKHHDTILTLKQSSEIYIPHRISLINVLQM